MDAPNPSATPTFASRTPLHVGAIGLKVRDLDRLTAFTATCSASRCSIAARTAPRSAPAASRSSISSTGPTPSPTTPREAGLYHTAFLMPTRADLARWILHVARNKVPLTGASDHAVSEAFYLDDPEGNGVEVYHDRPAETWEWTGDALKITTDPLDVDDILREVPPTAALRRARRTGCASATSICASATSPARRRSIATPSGSTVTRRRHGASFMSSGRYHHHIAGNVWHSAGAGRTRRGPGRACRGSRSKPPMPAAFEAAKSRLAQASAPLTATPTGIETADPWGTTLRIVRA